jgi:hypothetical protein
MGFFVGLVTQTFTFRDAKGNTASMRFWLNDAASVVNPPVVNAQDLASTLRTALVAASNAAYQASSGPLSEHGTAAYGATGAQYQDVPMKGTFVFQDTAGRLHRYALPAPKIALFKADQQTIDPANALVIAVKTALLATQDGTFFCSPDGTALHDFMGGVWQGRKIRRKLNILVLDPTLTPALPAE